MKLVIIGNGVAGVMTARFVADRDDSIDITIYSREPYEYYPRPRLIDFVAGEFSVEEMPQYSGEWYDERGIRTILSKEAVEIDRDNHRIIFGDGQTDTYDVLVLATGAYGWIPPIEGSDKKGVYTLRTLNDALKLQKDARRSDHVLILGGGLLGLDTAMALRSYDVQLTVVEALPWLLPRQLDEEGADLLQHTVESRGVDVITDDLCVRVMGGERVGAVELESGRSLEADLMLVSAGIRPDVGLAQSAGLDCDRGVIVNERLQTSDSDIYAVGDAAEFNGVVWGIIPAALAQARVVAAQVAGDAEATYQDIVPSTTLKVTGIDLVSIGEVNPEGGAFQEVRHVDRGAGIYKKLVIREDKVVGAILLGDRTDMPAISQLVSRGVEVSGQENELLEPDFDLRSFVMAQAPKA